MTTVVHEDAVASSSAILCYIFFSLSFFWEALVLKHILHMSETLFISFE